MRTTTAHLQVPHHQPSWWLGHGALAVVAAAVVVYASAVLLVVAGVLLLA